MKDLLAISYFFLVFAACRGGNSVAEKTCNDHIDTACFNQGIDQDMENPNGSLDSNRVPFMGELIVLDDSTHIMHQIEEIAAKDSVLSVERRVLNIGNVGFGINIHDSELLLISSTPVDDPKIEQVVDYFSSIYGVPEEMEPYHYWWKIKGDYENPGGLVRLRSLRGSEDGGTVILITP